MEDSYFSTILQLTEGWFVYYLCGFKVTCNILLKNKGHVTMEVCDNGSLQ